jgi:hypothetical protein
VLADISGGGTSTVNQFLSDDGTTVAFRTMNRIYADLRFLNATSASTGSDVNDFDMFAGTSRTYTRYASTGADRTITGITNGADGRLGIIQNTSSSLNLVLAHENAGSTAANRIVTPSGANVNISPLSCAILIYDNNQQRWVLANPTWLPATAAPAAIAAAASLGSSLKWAKEDHVHTIGANVVDNTMIRQGTARTIIGRSANSTGNVADIAGAGAGSILHDDGTTLAFRAISYLAYDRTFEADTMENPVSADWPVNVLAPAVADGTNSAEVVRAMDDTTEGGFGITVMIPESATNIIFDFFYWANSAPGATRTAGMKAYARRTTSNVAFAAFVTKTLTDLSIPNNRRPQVQSMTFALSAWSGTLAAGELTKFEITRIAPSAGTNLTGDLYVRAVRVRFS